MRAWSLLLVLASHLARADGDAEIVEVTGHAPAQAAPSAYDVDDDVRHLPGANDDALRAAEAMPGVARTPFSFGVFALRGSSPGDTGVYFDGVDLPFAFHFGSVDSLVPSALLAGVSIVPGGFDASYGRARGGIVALTTRDPRSDAWRAGGTAGDVASSAYAEGPVLGGGVIVAVRREYLDDVAAPFVLHDTPLPAAWDAELRGAWGDARGSGKLAPFVVVSSDHLTANALDVAASAAVVRAAVPYTKQWDTTTVHVVPWLGWTDVAVRLGDMPLPGGVPAQTLARPTVPGGVRADVTRAERWGELRAGVDLEGASETRAGTHDGATWLDAGAWTDALVRVGGRLAVRPGVRLDHYGLSDEAVVDPRLAVQLALGAGVVLHDAIGRYHQPPGIGDVDPIGGNPHLASSYADQMSLGLAAGPAALTGYYTYGRGYAVPASGGFVPPPDLGGFGPTFGQLLAKELGTSTYQVNAGRARDVGLELAVRGRAGRWFGLVSYTLASAQRTDDPAVAAGWHPYDLDQRHDLQAFGSVQLGAWQLGARVAIVSGDPYSPIVIDATGRAVVLPWAAALPTYGELDVRVDHRWRRACGELDAFLDVENATDRENLEGRTFTTSGRATDIPSLPLIPFVGVAFTPG